MMGRWFYQNSELLDKMMSDKVDLMFDFMLKHSTPLFDLLNGNFDPVL